MHPGDLTVSIDKLARFLCGWMGGPKRYSEKYGGIAIPPAHSHLPVGESEKQAWLDCMREALDKLDSRSRDIVVSRWLLDPKITLHTLAEKYEISAERIRQLEKSAFKTLKNQIPDLGVLICSEI